MISFCLSKVFTGSDSLVNVNKYHWITTITKKHHGCRQPSSIIWSHIQLYSSLLADDSLRVARTRMKSMAMLQAKKETVSHSHIMIFAKGAIAFPLFPTHSPRLLGSFNFTFQFLDQHISYRKIAAAGIIFFGFPAASMSCCPSNNAVSFLSQHPKTSALCWGQETPTPVDKTMV